MRLGLLGALAVIGVVGCGNGPDLDQFPTPQRLLDAAVAAYERGDCGWATRAFRRLTFELPPRDPDLATIRYYMAECLFDDGSYLEASREFQRVATDFPQSERAPTALLRAGDALSRLWKRPELDPTYGQNASSTYSELITRYPQSDAAATAQERLAELANKFALKDLKNGRFYERLKAFDSAIIYYRSVVANYPESRYAPEALMRLVRVYRRIGYEEDARDTCAHLYRFHADADGLREVCPDSSTS